MIAPVVRVAPAARRDLDAQATWFATQADPEVARRFAWSAADSFAKLAASPGLGSPVESSRAALRELRKWRVQGFPNLLIFYIPATDGVRVIRVIHAAQDWMAALSLD